MFVPDEGLYIIRFHSLYPWHTEGMYENIESPRDAQMKGWVRLFNQYDLYSKSNTPYTQSKQDELRSYYDGLVRKYLPETLDF